MSITLSQLVLYKLISEVKEQLTDSEYCDLSMMPFMDKCQYVEYDTGQK